MEWLPVKALLWALVVFLQIQEHRGCFEEERIGLLKLKAFLKSSLHVDYILPSWSDDAKSDCCGWERVTCNSTTGHAIELSLSQIKQDPLYYDDRIYRIWLLNVSLLRPFKELTSLDLFGNAIGGCLPNEGFEKLSSLRNLRILNLGYNYLDGNSSLQSLVEVTSLETLNLTHNQLDGQFPTQGSKSLSRMENLETLDLSGNKFCKSIVESLSSAKSIKNLNLGLNQISGSFPAQELSNLDNLERLDLSWNFLNGSLTVKDSTCLSRLKKLETLDLSSNSFNGSIIESLGAIKFLSNLNLASNRIEGPFPTQELSKFKKLETLDLSVNYRNSYFTIQELANLSSLKVLILQYNDLNGPLLVTGLGNFSRLEILDLSGNSFTGSISPFVGALSSLKSISLAFNHLTGTLPAQELCALTKLEEINIYGNLFEGIIPSCLNNMTYLRFLDISGNQFSGNISSIGIASPKSLEYIDVSGNHFKGLFSLSLFANHSKLQVIIFLGEMNKLEIETENPIGWEPLFQLKALLLSECNLNKLTGKVPTFLFGQHMLKLVDLSHNQLKGSFPIWLLEKNIGLQVLRLRNNSFVGKFHLPPHLYLKISWLDFSDNQLDGQLQKDLLKLTPKLDHLNLSRNHFEGYLPSSSEEECFLGILDLSFNNFSGKLPKELVTPRCFLSILKLNNNKLIGTIPASLRWEKLYYLDISKNMMTGVIPTWIGNTIHFLFLAMSGNFIHGQIPCELGSVTSIDLSHNLISGTLPSCLNLQRVQNLQLQGNKLTGSLPKSIFNSLTLSTLDLRNNNFSGKIPNEVGDLSNLRILLLKGNTFSGIIPSQICWLTKIDIMDLSKNSLSGTIPHCFNNMSFGKIAYSNLNYHQYIGVAVDRTPTSYQGYISWFPPRDLILTDFGEIVDVGFVTKYRLNSYSGNIINLVSGLDLSCNKLTGRIPLEITELSKIVAFNLSYNQLTGSIPNKFSNLTNLESLDLSHNNLSGEIPPTLIDLHFLEVFTVAYNNLSGRVPDMKAQFSTFDKRSYEGNSFLCGALVENSCTMVNESYPSQTKFSKASEEKWYKVDLQIFFPSFIAAYIIFFLSVTILLYINPHWQH